MQDSLPMQDSLTTYDLYVLIVDRYFSLQDPYNFTEENGEDLPTVAAIKRVKLALNPQVFC